VTTYSQPRSPVLLQSSEGIENLIGVYRNGLLADTLPFWIDHAVDRAQGGFLFSLDRSGSVIDTDKGMWQHGRFTWLLATLYSEVEPREEWLALAAHGVDFMRRYGFDTDGRMFFQVTRDGRPLRKRRYLFTETFGVIALAAYAVAAGDKQALQEAVDLFDLIVHYLTTPDLISPKFTDTRPTKGLGIPMILIATAQILRDAVSDTTIYNQWIDRCIAEIERDFMSHEFEAVLETVGPSGEFIDHFDGRTITPGHAIEAAWFIMAESKHRGHDPRLLEIGRTILDWSWAQGWDEEYGGILYFCDVKGLPVQEYWHDMKFWWPQNEAIIATLLAYQMTGEEKYASWHQMIHEWTYAHFPDQEYGEWFGYLHRDGRLSVPLKGNLWKGPFHMPRMQLVCWQILEEMGKS
jgi:N-acylglucosamine 2-epimerase